MTVLVLLSLVVHLCWSSSSSVMSLKVFPTSGRVAWYSLNAAAQFTVVQRTPYDSPSPPVARLNFPSLSHVPANFVLGQVAGLKTAPPNSTAPFSFFRDEVAAMKEILAWIQADKSTFPRALPVFSYGFSGPGMLSYLASYDFSGGQWVEYGTANLRETTYPGGALRNGLLTTWLGFVDPAAIAFVESEEAPVASFWDANQFTDYERVFWTTLHWAGWADIFQKQQIDAFLGGTAQGSGNAFLVVDPSGHCNQYGGFSADSSMLKNLFISKNFTSQARVILSLYEGGVFRGYWTHLERFPVASVNRLFFSNHSLTETPPTTPKKQSWVFDPFHPVPTVGGNEFPPNCGFVRQPDSVLVRPDVKLFRTAPFLEDTAVVGPVRFGLSVLSNCSDTDFTAKLLDYDPSTGVAINLADGIVRMRWQNSTGGTPTSLVAGKVYQIEIDLWYVGNVFLKGHVLGVAVSSSNFPRFSVNPNSGALLMDPQQKPVAALNAFIEGSASYVDLPIVPLEKLPKGPAPT